MFFQSDYEIEDVKRRNLIPIYFEAEKVGYCQAWDFFDPCGDGQEKLCNSIKDECLSFVKNLEEIQGRYDPDVFPLDMVEDLTFTFNRTRTKEIKSVEVSYNFGEETQKLDLKLSES